MANMHRAHNFLPTRFDDNRHIAFADGMRKLGYEVCVPDGNIQPGDVALMWNLFGGKHKTAQHYRDMGATVLVFEEGYVQPAWKHDTKDKMFACSRWGHNGSGEWPHGDGSRWAALGHAIKPWRTGEFILVCGQRGFGRQSELSMAMPDSWPQDVRKELRAQTDRPIYFRPHPKSNRTFDSRGYDRVLDNPSWSIKDDLDGCHCVVTWGSQAATHALLNGVQARYCAPHYIMSSVSLSGIDDIDALHWPDRSAAFERMAWAQWSMSEFESGVAYDWLLGGVDCVA